ncbi:hypothetical protein GRI58_14040 [Porphyrobacter algicida]|uniref:Phosphatase n=1 Tax=Qipengyuania algicida TaxID=1836209 RepID=A0A845AKE6_9SPHN|nr:hypothetical protein [Qipengyuania algicida]
MKHIYRSLVIGSSALVLASCGGDQIVSPGTTGDIIINNPAPTPTPTPTSSGGTGVTPASECPNIAATSQLSNLGTITGPTGTYLICNLPDVIDASTTLPYIKGVLYSMTGRVDVGTDQGPTSTGYNVVLTISPGAILYGATGRSFLVINRGNQIMANGTADRPIIFTSLQNIQGTATDADIGQWGGVVLLGRAPVADCSSGNYNVGGNVDQNGNPFNQADCQKNLEGTNVATPFGGTDYDDDSGEMSYFQIRYSGFSLAPGNELQSLSGGGIGRNTKINHWQSFNSSDDGMEFWGGEVHMDHVAVVGADDDSFDFDSGVQAYIQYALGVQRTAGGDNMIELDSPSSEYAVEALPRSNFYMTNFTFINQSTASGQAVRARGNAKLSLSNGEIVSANPCIRIDGAGTLAADPEFNSVVGSCNATTPFSGSDGVTAADVQNAWNAGSNNQTGFTFTLTMTYVNGSNEDGVPVYDPTAISSFFELPAHIGSAWTGNTSWTDGWTCSSSTLTFANANSACSTLPVY